MRVLVSDGVMRFCQKIRQPILTGHEEIVYTYFPQYLKAAV